MKFFKFGLTRLQKIFQKSEKFWPIKAPFTPLLLNGLLLVFLGTLVFNFLYSRLLVLQKQKIALTKIRTNNISQQISLWENVIREFPGFRDAYLKLAILNLKLSQTIEAKKYLDEVFRIDPNNKEASQLMVDVQRQTLNR